MKRAEGIPRARFLQALLLLWSAFVLSCVPPPEVGVSPERPVVSMPPQEQEEKSFEVFESMLEETTGKSIEEKTPVLDAGYRDIIRNYPDSFLAEESYLRLMLLNLENYDPPRVEEAERVYREYFRIYPAPRLNNAMNDSLARIYYTYGYWDRLAAFCVPMVKRYLEGRAASDALYLFYYSEAKLRLGEPGEAAKGYVLLQRQFGKGELGRQSADRLKAIEELGKKQK